MKPHQLLRITTLALALAAGLAGCASRAVDVAPAPASPAEFMAWGCARIDDESDDVQQRATDLAWTLDERVGTNIVALGVGVTLFWPALLAMRPDGLEAADLARLKGRYEALAVASRDKGCPPPAEGLSAARAAALPLALGERLVYEDRKDGRGPAREWMLAVSALRRGETEYRSVDAGPPPPPQTQPPPQPRPQPPSAQGPWLQDRAGNIARAPTGALYWPRLLRGELVLGAVIAGDMLVAGDPQTRGRLRGQVVAVGPQTVAGRRFDAAVIELFGDVQQGDDSTRVDGAIVVDRSSGVLLRLDLRSAVDAFSLQRRLVRVDPAS